MVWCDMMSDGHLLPVKRKGRKCPIDGCFEKVAKIVGECKHGEYQYYLVLLFIRQKLGQIIKGK